MTILDLNYAPNMVDVETDEFKKVLQNQINLPRNFGLLNGKQLSAKNPSIRTGKKDVEISDKKKKEFKHYQNYGKNMSESYKSMPLTKKVGKGRGSIVPINRDVFKPVEGGQHPSPMRDNNPHYLQTKDLNKKIRAAKAYNNVKKTKGFFTENLLKGPQKLPETQPRNHVTDRMTKKQRAEAHIEVRNDTNKAFKEFLNGRQAGSTRPNLSVKSIKGPYQGSSSPVTHQSNLMTMSQKVGIMQNAQYHSNDTKYQSNFNGGVTLEEATKNRKPLNIQKINGIGGNQSQGPLAHPNNLLTSSQKGNILKNMGLASDESILDPLINKAKNFFSGANPGEAEMARVFGGMAHVSGVKGFNVDLGNVQNLNPRELEAYKRGIRNEAAKSVRRLGDNVDPFFKEGKPLQDFDVGSGETRKALANYQHKKTYMPSEGINGYGLGFRNMMAASRAELGGRGLAFLAGRGGSESLMNSIGVMTSIQKSQMKARTNLFTKALTPGFMAIGGTYGSFMYNALTGGDVSDFAENQLSYVAGLQGWRVGSSFGGMIASPVENRFSFTKESTVKESAKTNLKQAKSMFKGNLVRGTTTFLGGATGALLGAGLVAGTSALVQDLTSNTSSIRKMAKDLHNSTMYMNTNSNNKTLTSRAAALNKLAKSGLNDRAMLLGNEARIFKGYM